MTTAPSAKCTCTTCSGHIGFDADRAGEIITCPHCGMDTPLFVPSAAPAKPRPPWHRRHRTKLLVAAGALVAIALLVWGIHYLLTHTAATEQIAVGVVGIIYAAILAVVFLWALLWILFPVFVYFSLERIKLLLTRIEANTRK